MRVFIFYRFSVAFIKLLRPLVDLLSVHSDREMNEETNLYAIVLLNLRSVTNSAACEAL